VTHDLVVSVIAPDAATADGLATAAGVLGASGAANLLAAFPGATATFRRSTSPAGGSQFLTSSTRVPPVTH
jgi:thiamine biosynthesis lipoprotein ApbE